MMEPFGDSSVTGTERALPDALRVLIVCAGGFRTAGIRDSLLALGLAPSRIAEAGDLGTALGDVGRERPDVVLLHDSAAEEADRALATAVAALSDLAPVIVLTRGATDDALVAALEAGAADHLPDEPASPAALGRALRRVLEHRWMLELACQGEQGYQVLIGLLDEGVVLHDPDGVVVACSATAERILATPTVRLAGAASLFSGLQALQEDASPLAPEDEPARIALKTRRPCPARIVRFRRNGGEVACVLATAAPLAYLAGGERPGALTVLQDITERRSLEHRLRGTHRMEAIGRLASGVAHDFNNLLTVILGYDDMLLRKLHGDDPRRHEAAEVRRAAERAAELTHQLLAFSRSQVIEPRVLDLNVVLTDMVAMLQRLIGEDIRLAVRTEPGLDAVRADRAQLEQVVLNLAINARDAMPLGGELGITTANVDLDQAFEDAHAGSRVGRYVGLSVEDNGCGMEGETLAHIFEPFFTTKSVDQGTGLGLSTVYGIVKQSGGYIDVESVPGQGTIFRVYLPRCEAVAEVEVPPAAVSPAPPGEETVLLVEDDEQVRSLAREILEQQGYHVLAEPDGGRALALLERHEGPIHALVTDVVMPGMGGPELARRAAERRPGLRVLYLSGYAEGALAGYDVPRRDAQLLAKPFQAETLLARLREVLTAPAVSPEENPSR